MRAPTLEPVETEAARARLDEVRRAVLRVYLGSPAAVDVLLVALLAHGHVLLEGVPGVAKTTLVKTFATALGGTMRRVQFTADLLPSDVTGTNVLSPRDGTFSFRKGPLFANVVLADEINRASAKTQAALLEAMQERQVTADGETYELPDPFFVLATQNPIDLEGTYPLPEAQIDRFLVHLAMGYPTHKDEVAMLRAHERGAPTASPVLELREIAMLQALARRVHVEDDLHDYATALAGFTRTHPRVLLGASPRATLGLVHASKGAALLEGRAFVTPDDLRRMARPVLAHRLVLAPEAEGDPAARDAVVVEALDRVGYRRQVRAT